MLKPLIVSLIVSLLASDVPVFAGADESLAPATGDKVRVTAPTVTHERVVGRLLESERDRLRIQTDAGNIIDIPNSEIRRLELDRGIRRTPSAGFVRGAGIGAAVVLLPCVFHRGSGHAAEPGDGSRAETCLVFGAISAGAGALLGGLLGMLGKADRWQPVSQPRRASLAVAPLAGAGIGAGLSVRF